MRHGSKTAAVVALAAALSLADASQAWAWGYGAALGQDGMTLDRLVSEVLKPIVQLAGYVLTAFGAYRYFQNRSDDGPAARQALGMLATGGVMVAFTAYDLGRGSLNAVAVAMRDWRLQHAPETLEGKSEEQVGREMAMVHLLAESRRTAAAQAWMRSPQSSQAKDAQQKAALMNAAAAAENEAMISEIPDIAISL